MDRRVKYTKKIIKENFIELLKEKELNKITVSELCEKSDINRATFYRYYIDIYDLLEKIEQELIDELKELLSNYKDYTLRDMIKEYLNIFLDNKELVSIIFSNRQNIFYLNDFFYFIYENCKEKWFENIELDEDQKTLFSIFAFNGTLGVINYWIQNGYKEDVDEISSVIQKICYKGLKGIKKDSTI